MMHLNILHSDQDLLAVDKPAGVATHAPQQDPYPSDLITALGQQLGKTYFGVHQRLDKETSGLVLLASRSEANAGLAESFETHEVEKRYLALVHGRPRRRDGVIDAPIAPAEGGRHGVPRGADRRAQEAHTRYRVLEDAPDGSAALLELIPETGRTHQLRVHMAHLGHPIIGDALYDQDRPAPRLMLHAHRLRLRHPLSGEKLALEAPPPPLFETIEQGLPALELAERLFKVGERAPDLLERAPEALEALLRLAQERRAVLAADPTTTAIRLINAAADGLPGLTLDRLGDTLVLSFYDEARRRVPPPLLEAIAKVFEPQSIYVKYRPRQASRLQEQEREEIAPPRPVWGLETAELAIEEDGLRYLVRPGAGLSVGLFLDMRETRGRVRRWARGQRVLNCFAYTCGFGLAASAGGAADVLNLDVSKQALEWGRENYRINGMEPPERGFLTGDLFEHLERFARKGYRFDMVILDPPSFATTKSSRFSATRDYGKLARLAAEVVAPDGLLLACSNLTTLSRRDFKRHVEDGVSDSGRMAESVGYYGASALDFPPAFGGESYLKVLALRFEA